MPTQTVTRAAESGLEPDRLYNVVAEAGNIPKWAPVFADSVERIDDVHYRVTKSGEVFNIEISLPNGRRGGAYIRVTPRPLGGSTITMTVPIGPNAVELEVAKVLEEELADLIRLAQL